MKKILVLFAFVFTVACYASPPPDPVHQFQTDQVQIVQNQFSADYTACAVEYTAVADNYSYERFEVNNLGAVEEVTQVKIPAALVIDQSYLGKHNLKKPPSANMGKAVNSSSSVFKINKQNTNFGYPLTADNC